MTKIYVLSKFTKLPEKLKGWIVDTTSKHNPDLSPFHLGPCRINGWKSRNMENAWQFSKLYPEHALPNGFPRPEWWRWARKGYNDPKAHRYPMGKGRKPLCSVWMDADDDIHFLDYIEARKHIYGPLYADCVQKTNHFKQLKKKLGSEPTLVLLDYDAYDHQALNMTLTDVLNDPIRKMGHAFVLMMLLLNDPALKQFVPISKG